MWKWKSRKNWVAAIALLCPSLGFSDQSIRVLNIDDDIADTPAVKAFVNVGDDGKFQSLRFSNLPEPITLSQLKNGITTMTVDNKPKGKPILRLQANVGSPKSDGFDAEHGGVITMTYLENGIKQTYKTFQMEIVRAGNDWLVRDTKYHVPCNKMFMRGNRLPIVGTLIGISKIDLQGTTSTIRSLQKPSSIFEELSPKALADSGESLAPLSKMKSGEMSSESTSAIHPVQRRFRAGGAI